MGGICCVTGVIVLIFALNYAANALFEFGCTITLRRDYRRFSGDVMSLDAEIDSIVAAYRRNWMVPKGKAHQSNREE